MCHAVPRCPVLSPGPQCDLQGLWRNELGSNMTLLALDMDGTFSGSYHTAVAATDKQILVSPLQGVLQPPSTKGQQPTFGFTVQWQFAGMSMGQPVSTVVCLSVCPGNRGGVSAHLGKAAGLFVCLSMGKGRGVHLSAWGRDKGCLSAHRKGQGAWQGGPSVCPGCLSVGGRWPRFPCSELPARSPPQPPFHPTQTPPPSLWASALWTAAGRRCWRPPGSCGKGSPPAGTSGRPPGEPGPRCHPAAPAPTPLTPLPRRVGTSVFTRVK